MNREMMPNLDPDVLESQMESNKEVSRQIKNLNQAFEHNPEPERTKLKTLAGELKHALNRADHSALDSLLNPLGETPTSLVRSLVEKNLDALAAQYFQELGGFNQVTNVKKRQQILEKIVKLAF